MTRKTVFSALTVALFLCGVTAAQTAYPSGGQSAAHNKPAGVSTKLPPRVLQGFEKDYPKVKIQGVRQNAINGQPVYEISFLDGQTQRNVVYNEYGAALIHTEEIAPGAVPPNVQSAVQVQCPGCKIAKAAKTTENNNVRYTLTMEERDVRGHVRHRTETFTSDGTMMGVK